LTHIASDFSVEPAARLSACFVLGDILENRDVVFRQLRLLANDSRADAKIRLASGQALAYFGDARSAEEVLIAISGNSSFDINDRLQASRSLEQFGGRRAVVDALRRILTNPYEEDAEDRVHTALAIPKPRSTGQLMVFGAC